MISVQFCGRVHPETEKAGAQDQVHGFRVIFYAQSLGADVDHLVKW